MVPFEVGEPIIRLGAFLGVLLAMIAWEIAAPRRARALSRWQRWPGNFSLVILGAVLVRLVIPIAAVGLAGLVADRGLGLFNQASVPTWLAVVLAVMLLDLVIYWQHVAFHAIPMLWRLHRVHHTDVDFDVSTALRFHPLEILISMLVKFAAIALLGAPPVAVLIFEILLNASAMFNHSNIRLPAVVDTLLRWIIVTPDMHRVHHSVRPVETNSNYGFSLPWWDRLFGSYRDQPADGHAAMRIGLAHFREPGESRVDRLLLQPLRSD